MKYAQKLICLILLVLGVSFSAGGSVLLWADHSDQLAAADAQNAAAHRMACRALESELLARQRAGEALDDDTLQTLAGDGLLLRGGEGGTLRLYGDRDLADAAMELKDGETVTVRGGGPGAATAALYRSAVYGQFSLVTQYDLTGLYAARDRSLRRYLALESVVLFCAALVAAWASHRITRPLAALTEASGRIAAGAYDQRTALHSGDEIGVLSASFDTMAAAVQEKIAALELGVQQRQDFMAAFSHELKTPMTSIIGYADMLRALQLPPAEQREAAGAIFHEGQRLETLSRKLLALLGLDETGLALAPMPMEDALAIFRRVAPFADCPPCDALVLGDADLLADLLYNLAQNGRRAGGRVWVRCAPDADGAYLILAVEDDGRGIPPGELDRVLEPFYMVDKSRARQGGGSGLGLTLCQRIAQAHGSELHLQSEPGRGTRVSFSLTLAALAPERGDAP